MKKLMPLLGAFVMVAAFFVSCSTSIPITVNHPPGMDTNGIERLVVMPFEGSGDRGRLASALTSIFREKISGTGKFKLVEPFAYKPGEGVADAVFTGSVVGYAVQNSSHAVTRTRKSSDGKTNVQYQVTVYDRKVSIEFTYRLIRDRDGVAIGERRISGAMTDSKENMSDLRPGDAMARSIAEGRLSGFTREIVPWTSQEKLTLDKETSKDKALKARMKDANALVKAGNLKAARDAYARIYADTNSLAAGYNQALLTHSLDGLDAAISLMSALVSATGYPKAHAELARLEGFRRENAAAAANQTGVSALDLAVKNAAEGLIAALPAGSRVSLLNISTSGKERVDVVIHEITASLMDGGIIVLDRENLDAINAEKRYQASGEVSDDSYVSIGRMLGVETIVTFSITGSGSQRKLAIKSVSVETGKILYNALTEI
ncbi:MAG: CsgG/HfaB family protein [Treponema sp.]|jgi:hypothetical protein|nr:CsgG/HfaB family protein [Treponema sp.]